MLLNHSRDKCTHVSKPCLLLRRLPTAASCTTAASTTHRQAYEAAIAAKKAEAAATQQASGEGGGGGLPAGLKLEDPSVLLQPGTRDGQTRVVREGGAGVAYAWDASK